MAYMIERANHIADQLERFTTGYAHHVVGQHANLAFWMDEVRQALHAIETYPQRFECMAEAQAAWVRLHDTRTGDYCPHCEGPCEFAEKMQRPSPPTQIRSSERSEAMKRLRNAAYYSVLRCYRVGLVDRAGVQAACEQVGTSLDPSDLS